jgi:hypothetical protein
VWEWSKVNPFADNQVVVSFARSRQGRAYYARRSGTLDGEDEGPIIGLSAKGFFMVERSSIFPSFSHADWQQSRRKVFRLAWFLEADF